MVLSECTDDETSTTWPAACPHPSESNFLSVVVRPQHYHFAVHEGKSHGYRPTGCWKVPITKIPDDHDESNKEHEISVLVQYIPPLYHSLFFPKNTKAPIRAPTIAEVIDFMVTSKEAPVVSMYIIRGTDPQANRKLEKVFQRYPVRISYLQHTDFRHPSRSSSLAFPGVSVHNAAGVCGAAPFPRLILKSDNVLTLTTVEENGHIAGVTILMGIVPRLEFAVQNADAETLGGKDGKDLVDYFLKRKEPLVMSDPVHAVLIGALEPLLHSVVLLLQNFVEMYGETQSTETNFSSIVLHGPHSDVLHSLLQQQNLSKLSKELVSNRIPNVKVDEVLVHRGIGNMLMMHDTPVIPGSDRDKCLHFVGQRVARRFPRYQDSVYRGVVSGFVADREGTEWDDHLFEVIYDDGDRENLTIVQLYEALRLYSMEGEKLLFVATSSAVLAKQESSRAAARSLLTWTAKVQNAVERPPIMSSDHSNSAVENEGMQTADDFTDRKQASSKPDERQGTGKSPRKQMTRKRKASVKNQRSNKKQLPADESPYSFVGRRVAKEFEGGLFFGRIVSVRKNNRCTYWQVKYDDNDEEEFDYEEVVQHTDLYESSRSDQTQSGAICISDGEQGDAGAQHSSSMNVTGEPEGKPDQQQPEVTQLHTATALHPLQQDTVEPTAISDHDDVHEPVPSSDKLLTFDV